MADNNNPTSGNVVIKIRKGSAEERKTDQLTGEEPLGIVIQYWSKEDHQNVIHPLSITMRTPGSDEELVLGFLLTEGVINSPEDLVRIRRLESPENKLLNDQTLVVELKNSVHFDRKQFSRNFYTTSSCGICGKNSINQIEGQITCILPQGKPRIPVSVILQLNERMKSQQKLFAKTGGIHAAAVFDTKGKLLFLREDVGRHNAMDKVIGTLINEDQLPALERIVSVSGRASFELVQKALMAGFPILTAVGAPSDLAVRLADAYGMTLIGFLKNEGFNLYSHPERIDY